MYSRMSIINCIRMRVGLHSKVTLPFRNYTQKGLALNFTSKVHALFPIRNYQKSSVNHTKSMTSTNVTYEDLIQLKKKGDIFLVDVREPEEIAETGKLPGSTHIPLGELKTALELLSAEEFRNKYGVAKPGLNAAIVFSCKAGVRSAKATEIAGKAGFKNSRSFGGGFMEWAEKSKNS